MLIPPQAELRCAIQPGFISKFVYFLGISIPFIPMASVSQFAQKSSSTKAESPYAARFIAQTIGLVCLAGFLVDISVLMFPLSLGSVEWRIGLLQQVGDRSIILLFAVGLLLFSQMANRSIRKKISFAALALGALFVFSSVVAIRDGSKLGRQTNQAIDSQANAVLERIEQVKGDASLAPNLSPEQLLQAEQQLTTRAQQLQSQAKIGTLRRGVSSVGNLSLVGIGLILLGRFGQRGHR